MGWRWLLHRFPFLERRWIPRPEDREAHAALVRRRLRSRPADAPAEPEPLPGEPIAPGQDS